jgi:hypothetical protein
MYEKVLNATPRGGGVFTSLPLFDARKTACREAGIRPPRSVVELFIILSNVGCVVITVSLVKIMVLLEQLNGLIAQPPKEGLIVG